MVSPIQVADWVLPNSRADNVVVDADLASGTHQGPGKGIVSLAELGKAGAVRTRRTGTEPRRLPAKGEWNSVNRPCASADVDSPLEVVPRGM